MAFDVKQAIIDRLRATKRERLGGCWRLDNKSVYRLFVREGYTLNVADDYRFCKRVFRDSLQDSLSLSIVSR